MANPTTNFGWVMPTSSSLVTNLPADFNTFGQAVDTSMSELLGGTTGQVLSKTSNTSMDFTWVTPTDQTPLTTKGDLFTFTTVDARLGVGTNGYILSANSATATGLEWIANDQGDITAVTAGTGISGGGTSGAVTITNSMATEIAAKGDLIVGTGSATFDNLGVGTNGQVLTADSTVSPTGLKWASAGSGALTKITSASFSAVTDTGTTFDGIFSSTYANYVVIFKGYSGTDNVQFQVQTRVGSTTQTGVDYYGGRWWVGYNGSTAAAGTSGQTKWQPAELRTTANNDTLINMNFSNVGTGSSVKPMFNSTAGGGWLAGTYLAGGAIATTSYNCTGLIFSASSGTITGTVYVYGVQN